MTKRCFVPVPSLVEIDTLVREKKFFEFLQCVLVFVIISLWKRAWPLISTNLNRLHSSVFCANFSYLFWGRRRKCEKGYNDKDDADDYDNNGKNSIRKADLGLWRR